MSIQQSVNAAIGGAARAAAVSEGLEKEGEKRAEQAAAAAQQAEKDAASAARQAAADKKQADAENLKGISAVEDYRAAAQMAEGAAALVGESAAEQSGIQAKIEAQRQKLKQEGLTPRQQAGHKGYITRMEASLARVEEERGAREYQQKLLERRKEVLRSIHGAAWERLGIDPEGGGNGQS